MEMDFTDIGDAVELGAKIKVVGVGGGGGNAINNMIHSNLQGVTFIAANTDLQALAQSKAHNKVQLGAQLTKGLGAGAQPEKGREAAMESIEEIKRALEGADMVFITAGMGGGTGTGAAPVIAQAAREMGALTVGVVTKPFKFEGAKRLNQAEHGIRSLREMVDSIITIPNDRLVALAHKKASFKDMLKKADEVLHDAVKGISDVVNLGGFINLDFADVQKVMREMGLAMMGAGSAKGANRAVEAATMAINSPLLEDVSIHGARGVLINISASSDLTMDEVNEAIGLIQAAAQEDVELIFGTVFDEALEDELRVTVIATGIEPVYCGEVQAHGRTKTREPFQIYRGGPAGAYGGEAAGGVHGSVQGGAPRFNTLPGAGAETGLRRQAVAFGTDDLNEPTYLRKRRAAEAGLGAAQATQAGRSARPSRPGVSGEEDFIFDEDEMDIPSFIRMQAD